MDTGSLNFQWAFSIVHGFFLSGVTQAVISPGSRSTPLSLACERHAGIQTWVHVDERSAAFFALGQAIKTQQAVILICTSGSAVANWLPAVVEADYSKVPLLLLSADRPAELQNCGANQTINQANIFANFCREFIAVPEPELALLDSQFIPQLVAKAYSQLQQTELGPGAVHLNIPFREPLLPDVDDINATLDAMSGDICRHYSALQAAARKPDRVFDEQSQLQEILTQGKGLLVLGRKQYSEAFKTALAALLNRLNIPVLVDHLSGFRLDGCRLPNVIMNYDVFLRQSFNRDRQLPKPDWVIRFGQMPVSKALAQYLAQPGDTVSILVSEHMPWQDPLHNADYRIHASDEDFCEELLQYPLAVAQNSWPEEYKKWELTSEQAIVKSLDSKLLFEGHLISCLLEHLQTGSFIFTANSMPVRELDTFISQQTRDKDIAIFCNRGASGIDGNLSTYLGILSATAGNYGVALVGDLSFFHDMNGLSICQKLNQSGFSGTIIVINNNGGGIFNYLPQQQLREFEKCWLTPLDLDYSHTAKLYQLNYTKVDTIESMEKALTNSIASKGIDIIEVIIDRDVSFEIHQMIWNS